MPATHNHLWSILKAWKDQKIASLSLADSDVCSEEELKRRARALGIPAAQLRWVPSRSPDPISLLERRMEALLLNPDEVAHTEPLMIRELQHRCVGCGKRRQCALDLADRSADPGWQCWRAYCPNAATLLMLSVLQSGSKASNNRAAVGLKPENGHLLRSGPIKTLSMHSTGSPRSQRRSRTFRLMGHHYRHLLAFLKALIARIDLRHFPGSCCG